MYITFLYRFLWTIIQDKIKFKERQHHDGDEFADLDTAKVLIQS